MKVTMLILIILSQMAHAEGPICEKIKTDIKNIGDRISNFSGNEIPPSASYKELASEYDKALAEELLYNGLKDMLQKYEKSKKDLGTPKLNYSVTFKQISQEGIDIRRRLVVLKDMVDFADTDGNDATLFYEQQKKKKCASYTDPSVALANCQAKYHKYQPMINGYFQAIKKIGQPEETLTLFNEEVAKINDANINIELEKLEKTEEKLLSASEKCKNNVTSECKEIVDAVKEQEDFFSKILLSEKSAVLENMKGRYQSLREFHKIYNEDPKQRLEQEFKTFKEKVESIFNCKAKEIINSNNSDKAEVLFQSLCGKENSLSKLEDFQKCFDEKKFEDLDKRIATARANKVNSMNKLEKLLNTNELKNLMEVQKLLYERYTSSDAACIGPSTPQTKETYKLGCTDDDSANPMGGEISFLVDSQKEITLFLRGKNSPSEDTVVKNSAVNRLKIYCEDGGFILTSCNIQTPEQKVAQQNAAEFYGKYYYEKSTRKNGPDRLVKRESLGSMFAKAAVKSATAPDTMPFFMGAMTFNGRLDMMTEQALWQKQTYYNMEQWNNIYMGNVYGGLNNPASVFDPTLGGQNAADFGFSFTQS